MLAKTSQKKKHLFFFSGETPDFLYSGSKHVWTASSLSFPHRRKKMIYDITKLHILSFQKLHNNEETSNTKKLALGN